MAWIYLFVAGVLEITWAVGMRYSAGWTRLGPSLVTVVALAGSMYFMTLAVRTLPLGTAYAIWTGIGAAGTAVLGMILFHEPATLGRILFLGLIVLGIAGLRLVSP